MKKEDLREKMRIKQNVKGQKRNNLKELRRTEKDRRLRKKH